MHIAHSNGIWPQGGLGGIMKSRLKWFVAVPEWEPSKLVHTTSQLGRMQAMQTMRTVGVNMLAKVGFKGRGLVWTRKSLLLGEHNALQMRCGTENFFGKTPQNLPNRLGKRISRCS